MNSIIFTNVVTVIVVVATLIWFYVNHFVVFTDYVFRFKKDGENDSFLYFFKNYKKFYIRYHHLEDPDFKKTVIIFFKSLAIIAIFVLIFLFFVYAVSKGVSFVSKSVF